MKIYAITETNEFVLNFDAWPNGYTSISKAVEAVYEVVDVWNIDEPGWYVDDVFVGENGGHIDVAYCGQVCTRIGIHPVGVNE